MAKYYTLEEAAKALQTSTDEVRELADKKEVRAFRDRGTLRFRAEEIDELARQRGLGSDPELQFSDLPEPKKSSTPAPKKKEKKDKTEEADVLPFDLADEDDVISLEGGFPKDTVQTPRPGSDSDVRLVSEGSDQSLKFDDSDEVTLGKSPAPAPDSGPISASVSDKSSDSGVRIVPLDDASDSDVKMVVDDEDEVELGGKKKSSRASDSDIRLENVDEGSDEHKGVITEEIDLDEELKQKSPSKLPTDSPFELSEDELTLGEGSGKGLGKSSSTDLDSSDDFILTPAEDESSEEMPVFSLQDDDEEDEVDLGSDVKKSPHDSGINLTDPADSGISLEQEGSDEMEVKLDLDDDSPRTPAPKKAARDDDDDSSSEFELTLDEDDSSSEFELDVQQDESPSDSSEFELTLDDSSGEFELEMTAEDSDSEFELTLDESDSDSSSDFELESIEEDSGSEFELTLDDEDEEDDKDIFATDFDVPALEDESGSEVMPLDEDDTSDFDLAIDDEDFETEESGSQVVPIDEDEADAAAATVARPSKKKGKGKKSKATALVDADEDDADDFVIEEDDEDSDFAGLEAEEDEEEEEDVAVAGAAAPAVPWGPLPAIMMFPCVILLFVVGLMTFEMIQTMWGHKSGNEVSGIIVKPLTKAILGDNALPK